MNSQSNIDSKLTSDEVLALFKATYLPMKRPLALAQLDINERLFCDFVAGRRNVHKCKKVLRALRLEPIEMFAQARNGKDSK